MIEHETRFQPPAASEPLSVRVNRLLAVREVGERGTLGYSLPIYSVVVYVDHNGRKAVKFDAQDHATGFIFNREVHDQPLTPDQISQVHWPADDCLN